MTYVEADSAVQPELEGDEMGMPEPLHTEDRHKNGITGDVSDQRAAPPADATPAAGTTAASQLDTTTARVPNAGLEYTAAVMQATRYEIRGDNSVLYHVYDKPAYIDHGPHLLMCAGAADNEASVVGALLHAREKFGGKIELTGSDEFKAFALQMLVKHNVAVTLKNPQQHAQLQELRKAITQAAATQGANADGISGSVQDRPADAQTEAKGKPVVAQPAAAEKQDGRQEGVLIAHGQAPYNNDKDGRPSYFATLRQADGSDATVWGVDLPRALEAAKAREGDTVSLATVGRKPVEVTVNERQPDGSMLPVTRQALRNEWEAKVLATWEAKVKPAVADAAPQQPESQAASPAGQGAVADAPKVRRTPRRR